MLNTPLQYSVNGHTEKFGAQCRNFAFDETRRCIETNRANVQRLILMQNHCIKVEISLCVQYTHA